MEPSETSTRRRVEQRGLWFEDLELDVVYAHNGILDK